MFAEFDWVEATRSSPIMLVLLVCSLVTMAVAIERLLYFRRRSDNPDPVLLKALESLRKGNLSSAIARLQGTAHPMGRVAEEVLSAQDDSVASSEERLQISLSQQKLLLEKHLSVLGSMAAVAPLVGLLGTVVGIMRAFHDMAQVGSAAPSVVAAGVAEALLTTAAGLVVAVPAVLLYNHFARRMSVMLTLAENHTRSLRAACAGIPSGKDLMETADPTVDRISDAISVPKAEPVTTPGA
jgi:biopolymer transport protein ExbB